MGIPRLTAKIKPFGKPVCITDNEDGHKVRAIIDGPSLAFYIFYNTLWSVGNHSNYPLGALPTNDELSIAFLKWLQDLERYGLQIAHIFFDGYLPTSKTAIRMQRLQKSLTDLRNFHLFTAAADSPNTNRAPQALSSNLSRPRPLPVPTFLVAVFIETLKASKYRSCTAVVPCEGEIHCASTVVSDEDVVLTNDSDLLVLVKRGRIVFLDDLQLNPNETRGTYYRQADFLHSLNCTDVVALVYFLYCDRHKSLTQCADLARGIGELQGAEKDNYDTFAETYSQVRQSSKLGLLLEQLQPNAALSQLLRYMEPRTSELIHNWGSSPGVKIVHLDRLQQKSDEPKRPIRMHLPFLIDDPTRASAWRTSFPIRRFAYSLLAASSSSSEIEELDRRGEDMVRVPIDLSAKPSMATTPICLLRMTGGDADNVHVIAQAAAHSERPSKVWKSLALRTVLRLMLDGSTNLPARALVSQLALASKARRSWAQIHLSAQVEGLLYSIFMVRQVLEVLHAGGLLDAEVMRVDTSLLGELGAMISSLSQMPGLKDVTNTLPGWLDSDEALALDNELSALYASRSIPDGWEKDRNRRQRNTTRKEPNESKDRPKTKFEGRNIFSVLEEEG